MPRKTTILIIVLAIITGILIFLAVRSDNSLSQNNTIQQKATPEPTSVVPFATLGFETALIDASNKSTNQKVKIIIDTQNKPVAGAQIELSYDPLLISNVKFDKPETPFFGKDANILINSVDPTLGRASYAVGINSSSEQKVGLGTVVDLSFTANTSSLEQNTMIKFIDKSAISTLNSLGSSVLKSTTPLQVVLKKPSTTN